MKLARSGGGGLNTTMTVGVFRPGGGSQRVRNQSEPTAGYPAPCSAEIGRMPRAYAVCEALAI